MHVKVERFKPEQLHCIGTTPHSAVLSEGLLLGEGEGGEGGEMKDGGEGRREGGGEADRGIKARGIW
jgi:hypothetical protein